MPVTPLTRAAAGVGRSVRPCCGCASTISFLLSLFDSSTSFSSSGAGVFSLFEPQSIARGVEIIKPRMRCEGYSWEGLHVVLHESLMTDPVVEEKEEMLGNRKRQNH